MNKFKASNGLQVRISGTGNVWVGGRWQGKITMDGQVLRSRNLPMEIHTGEWRK